ncbi:uncharacterized protein METZ01_LOCUS384352 [marine metagenome]|uniref:Uncharacterized protein n=1 Tax=marine metagenome TaxID=408172 RepID=A0A382UCU9_9ZZZZ
MFVAQDYGALSGEDSTVVEPLCGYVLLQE